MHILFVCPHGAAKSVIAAAISRDRSKEFGLPVTSDSVGTEPDDVMNPIAIDALKSRGVECRGLPRMIETSDVSGADLVISLGVSEWELPAEPKYFIDWSDVPDASDDVDLLYFVLEQRIRGFLDGLSVGPTLGRDVSFD